MLIKPRKESNIKASYVGSKNQMEEYLYSIGCNDSDIRNIFHQAITHYGFKKGAPSVIKMTDEFKASIPRIVYKKLT